MLIESPSHHIASWARLQFQLNHVCTHGEFDPVASKKQGVHLISHIPHVDQYGYNIKNLIGMSPIPTFDICCVPPLHAAAVSRLWHIPGRRDSTLLFYNTCTTRQYSTTNGQSVPVGRWVEYVNARVFRQTRKEKKCNVERGTQSRVQGAQGAKDGGRERERKIPGTAIKLERELGVSLQHFVGATDVCSLKPETKSLYGVDGFFFLFWFLQSCPALVGTT